MQNNPAFQANCLGETRKLPYKSEADQCVNTDRPLTKKRIGLAMADNILIPVERLRLLLTYEPASGLLFWKVRPREMFSSDRAHAMFNAKYAGREAFTYTDEGYRRGMVDGVKMRAHRVIYAMCHGEWPEQEIDHIDGNPSNNRITNLRNASHQENSRNRCRRSDNSSGVVGVFREKTSWTAQIGRNGRNRRLGSFKTKEEAIAARRAAVEDAGFHANHGRRPYAR